MMSDREAEETERVANALRAAGAALLHGRPEEVVDALDRAAGAARQLQRAARAARRECELKGHGLRRSLAQFRPRQRST